jgi:hypothetical protein
MGALPFIYKYPFEVHAYVPGEMGLRNVTVFGPENPSTCGLWPKSITRVFCSLGNHTLVDLLLYAHTKIDFWWIYYCTHIPKLIC